MSLLTKNHYLPLVALLVLVGGAIFLFASPAQVVEDPSVPDEVAVQPSLPNRAPAGYQVPARPVVTLPFTNVSADRLRLANVQEISEGRADENTPIIVSPPSYLVFLRSPDGQWDLSYSPELGNLSVTRVGGTGERNMLFTDLGYRDDSRTSIYYPRLGGPHGPPVVWSWDSNRLFYRVERRFFYQVEQRYRSGTEQWIESVDIRTGETTRHTDISFYSDLHSYATARYPDDPVLFDDSPDNKLKGPRGIKTRDGSTKWVIDDFYPLYLSPNKQMVLGYKVDDEKHSESEAWYRRHYLVYAVDGTGPLHGFQFDEYSHWYLPAPIWSPDGSKLVYKVTEYGDDTGPPIASDLYLMNTDGTGKTNLTDNMDIFKGFHGWTADGRLVFHVSSGWYIADLVAK